MFRTSHGNMYSLELEEIDRGRDEGKAHFRQTEWRMAVRKKSTTARIRCAWRVKCVKECNEREGRGGLGSQYWPLEFPSLEMSYLPPFYSSMVYFPPNVTLCPQAQPIFSPPSNKSPLIPKFHSSQTIFARFQKAIKRSLKGSSLIEKFSHNI